MSVECVLCSGLQIATMQPRWLGSDPKPRPRPGLKKRKRWQQYFEPTEKNNGPNRIQLRIRSMAYVQQQQEQRYKTNYGSTNASIKIIRQRDIKSAV